ncbi:ATP-binding cassette domain-containing protein [Paenibacillus sp. JTLBN-2024]
MFGFLGPNGAGKSTTIRRIMGFMKPARGNRADTGF